MATRTVAVFGSNVPLPGDTDYAVARRLGFLLAKQGLAVATGGYGGTMAAASQGASEGGGLVWGIGSRRIERYRNVSLNPWVQQSVRYDTLQERVMHLVVHNDGMVVLPGGIGTLSEFALAWSFLQVGEIEPRPLVLLGDLWRQTVETFFQPQYVAESNLSLLCMAETPEEAVAYLADQFFADAAGRS